MSNFSAGDEDLDVLEKVMAEAVEADSSARQERPKMKGASSSYKTFSWAQHDTFNQMERIHR